MGYNFPDAPTVGQAYSGYVYDGEKWLAIAGAPNMSGVISIQVFTASGTYTPSTNMTTCVIECWGGGGAGGGSTGTATTTNVGGGGGGGSYSRSTLTAAAVGASQPIVIGAGGTVGAAGAAGNAGGATTFGGTIVTATGGTGGSGGGYSQTSQNSSGLGTGHFTTLGARSGTAIGDTTANATIGLGAMGAASTVGGAGSGGNASSASINGASGAGYAAGGGGGASNRSATTSIGGPGAPGLVVITEYGMIALSSSNAQGMVRFDLPQSLTANQTAQARANIWVTKKNYIVNGGMMISQENGNTAGTLINYYPVDQFYAPFSHAGGQTIQQATVATPGGAYSRIRITVTTPDASVGPGDISLLIQNIEGLRVIDLKAGTATPKTVTLQFGVKAPAGTYCVAFRNATPNRCYVAEYVISAGEANTDVIKSVTLTLDTTGTWATDNTTGISVIWTLMAGTTSQTPANIWTAGNFFGTANQFNFMGTGGNTFELFDVSLTEGSVAPPFQVPDYAAELALCQRYYELVPSIIRYPFVGLSYGTVQFAVTKRATPTVALASVTYSNASAAVGQNPSLSGTEIGYTTSAVNGYAMFTVQANARLP